jgi:hypothetical protein
MHQSIFSLDPWWEAHKMEFWLFPIAAAAGALIAGIIELTKWKADKK